MMKKILGLALLSLLVSCDTEVEAPIDPQVYGYEFFPLEVGKYRVYQVDSIQFDVGGDNLPTQDSSTFFLREETVEQYEDETGAMIYRIERYRADTLGAPWRIVDVVTQSRSINQAYHTEDNVKYIPMVFPIKEGQEWDGNAFVPEDMVVLVLGESIEMFKGWQYKVLATDQAETIGPHTYDAVVTIQQSDDENLIEYRHSIEKYAKDVGRIYRFRQILDSYCKYISFNDPCIDKTWREKAGRGFIVREVLIEAN